VALAGVELNISIDIFTVAVDDIFTSEYVVLLKRIVRPKSISIDGKWLLIVVREQEPGR